MSFADDMERIAERMQQSIETVSQAIVIDLFQGVIENTRVDTGRLRGNWQTSVGAPIRTEIERLDQVPEGSPGGAAYREVAQVVKGAGVINYLTNNLPYAQIWNERDGLVDREIARLQRTVEEQARRVRQ